MSIRLNELLKTWIFHPWNVDEIPADDLAEIEDWILWRRELSQID